MNLQKSIGMNIKIVILAMLSLFLNSKAEALGLLPEDLAKIQTVSDPDFHPNGTRIVYSVDETDFKHDVTVSDLWYVAIDGKSPPKRLTQTDNNEWHPQYSPDGKSIFFLADYSEDKSIQVWRIPAQGGKAKIITRFAQGVEDYDLSPDGKQLAVIVKDSELKPGEKKPLHPKPIVTTRFQFKEDITGYLDDRRLHVYLVQINNGDSIQLTQGEHDEYLPAFSPDGKRIAFVTKRGDDPDRLLNNDIYTVDAKTGGKETQITHFIGTDLDPY